MRGCITRPRSDGSLDVYLWVHNPMREVPINSTTIPLYRIHVPKESDIDDSDPFANFTYGWTNIRMTSSNFTYPSRNPYYHHDSTVAQGDRFQYNIIPYAIKLRDSYDSGKVHHFFVSAPNLARDPATHRTLEVLFDDNDPDAGEIIPVSSRGNVSNEDTAYGNYVGGTHIIKKDDTGTDRCIILSNPHGISELYFVNYSGARESRVRHYPYYTPVGDRVESRTKINKLFRPIIDQKGIVGGLNEFASAQNSALQWVNKSPANTTFDPSREQWENYAIYHQYNFGIIAVDLSSIIAKEENFHDVVANKTRLINNYSGDLSCMHIYNSNDDPDLLGHMQQGTVKNMLRFNSQLIDTHGNGSVWFFDWRPDYLIDNEDWYNLNRDYQHRRGILEVRVDSVTDQLQVIGHNTGRKNITTNAEQWPYEIGAEGLCKVYGTTFIMANANNSSSINAPKFYSFNTQTKTFSLLSMDASAALSLLPMKDLGIISCSHLGNGTAINYIDMLPSNSLHTTRTQTSLLSTIEALTARIEALES